MKEFPVEDCAASFLRAGHASFFILITPFDLNNPRSILNDDCVAGCQFRVGRTGANGVVCLSHGAHQTPVKAVLIDSGIERNDIVKALAPGPGVLVGRADFHGLAAAGEAGSARCCAV